MEALFALIFVAFLLAWLILPIINFVRHRGLRHRSEERWDDLEVRLNALTRELTELKKLVGRPPTPIEPAAKPVAGPQPTPPMPRPPAAAPVTPPAPQPSAPTKIRMPEPPSIQPPPAPLPLAETPTPPPPPRPPAPTVAKPAPPPVAARTAPPAPPRRFATDLEETLGANWLNKLGIVILVFGIAFYLAYQLTAVGPAGKVLVGYLVGAVLLSVGVFFERRERYRVLARTGIGGGWAVVFFTTYAMHHVPAARVLDSQAADLVLMLVVAAAMVAHSLRYRSQMVTGLAFLLGFSTVFISHVTVYSLSAGAVLALGLVVIVVRMRWYELEVFGLLASYLNHFYWLRGIIEPMGGQRRMFDEFWPSAVLLVLYWLAFRVSYLVRRIEDSREEGFSTVAALLNTGLLLALLRYQSVRPELAFWVLLALGATELVLGQIPRLRGRRPAFVILSTVGASLLVAAFPFRYSGQELSVLWLVEAESFFLAGVFNREVLFRRFGMLAGFLAAAQFLQAMPMTGGVDLRRAVLFATAALVFWADAHWVPRRWRDLEESDYDALGFRLLSYLGGSMALAGVWLLCGSHWTAVGWAGLAVLLGLAGRRWNAPELAYQASAVAVLSFARVLWVDLRLDEPYLGLTLRVVTCSLVAGLLYAVARWSDVEDVGITEHFPVAHRAAASMVVALLLYVELPSAWIAVAWLAFALALALVGRWLKLTDLSFQPHLLAAAGIVRFLVVNLFITDLYHQLPLRRLTGGLAVALVYVLSRWGENKEIDFTRWFPAAYTWSGSFLLALLLWYELRPTSVALGWAAMGVVLLEIGLARRSLSLRLQAYVAFAASFFRIFFVNLNAESPPGEISLRLYTVLPLALVYYLVYARLAGREEDFLERDRRLKAGDLHGWLGTVALAGLLRFEAPLDWVAAAWAGLVLLLLVFAWQSGRRLFLHQGLLLCLAVASRAVLHDFYGGGYFPSSEHHRLWTVGTACALLFLSLPFAFRLREKPAEDSAGVRRALRLVSGRPEQLLFFVPLALLTILLALELPRGQVTMSWGIEAVVVFVFALLARERSFRLSALTLLLLCVGKIVLIDVWGLNPRDRYLTFIVLGSALLVVSYFYTRYRETFHRYL